MWLNRRMLHTHLRWTPCSNKGCQTSAWWQSHWRSWQEHTVFQPWTAGTAYTNIPKYTQTCTYLRYAYVIICSWHYSIYTAWGNHRRAILVLTFSPLDGDGTLRKLVLHKYLTNWAGFIWSLVTFWTFVRGFHLWTPVTLSSTMPLIFLNMLGYFLYIQWVRSPPSSKIWWKQRWQEGEEGKIRRENK